jgi:hypothetical protein
MAEKDAMRTTLGPPVSFSEDEAKQSLAGLVLHFHDRARETSKEEFSAAQALLRTAQRVLRGDLNAKLTLRAIEREWPDSVTYPITKGHEFPALGEVVDHILSGTFGDEPDPDQRAASMAWHVCDWIAGRMRSSPYLRGLAPAWEVRLPDARAAVLKVLQSHNEAQWKRARAKVIRAALRSFGVEDRHFKNDDFEPRPSSSGGP